MPKADSEVMKKRKFILDIDPGLDDARALIFFVLSPNIEVIAVTTVGGNSFNYQTAENTRRILSLVGRENIPVYMSTPNSLDGEILVGDGYYGRNGLCEVELPHSDAVPINDELSHEALVRFVNNFPNQISILSLGPATNIARAYYLDTNLPNLIDEIYVMGTDRAEKTLFNVTPFAEFNSHRDPQAMNLVLTNFGKKPKSKIFLVDFTLIIRHPTLGSFYSRMGSILKESFQNDMVEKLYQARPEEFYRDESVPLEEKTLFTADEIASLIAFDPTIIVSSHRVILERMHFAGELRGHSVFKDDPKGNIEIVDQIDMNRFLSIYEDGIKKT